MMTSSVHSPRQLAQRTTKIREAKFDRADDDCCTRPDKYGDLGPRSARPVSAAWLSKVLVYCDSYGQKLWLWTLLCDTVTPHRCPSATHSGRDSAAWSRPNQAAVTDVSARWRFYLAQCRAWAMYENARALLSAHWSVSATKRAVISCRKRRPPPSVGPFVSKVYLQSYFPL